MISGTTSHSDCHAPRLRGYSPAKPERRVLTSAGTRDAQARIEAEATGFCLCGMVEEPPRPAEGGSESSPTSVCMYRERSREIFAMVPESRPKVVAVSAIRSRCACQGMRGSGG